MRGDQIKIKRINGTKERGLYGPWVIFGPIDDSYLGKMRMFTKQGGEYRLTPMNYPPTGFCLAINGDPYFAPDVAKKSNLTLPLPCPLSNVGFQFQNYIDTHLPQIPDDYLV
jgi:hypothetical protein